MSSRAAVGLVLGCVMIYLGFFGLSGMGMLALTGDIMREDWNSLSLWTIEHGTPEINPTGQLHMVPPSAPTPRITLSRKDVSAPSQFTVEFRCKVDQWGSGGLVTIQFYTSTHLHALQILQDRVKWAIASGTYQEKSLVTDTNWHTWTLTVNVNSVEVKLYDGTTLVATWNKLFALTSATPQVVYIMQRGDTMEVESHTDYIYVDSGIKPPTGDGSTTGTIIVKTYLDGVEKTSTQLGIPVYLSGPGGKRSISTPYTGTHDPGTYTATASYLGEPSSASDVLTAGGTITLQLYWGTTPPPPPNGDPDFLQIIKDIIDDPTVRNLLKIGGFAIVGISAIVLVMPVAKQRYHAPPRPSPPPYY